MQIETVCERPASQSTGGGSPSARVSDGATPSRERELGLDWLRVIAFALLILYHSGMAYVSWGWLIKDAQRSPALESGMLFLNRWRLPLLFLISGAGVSFSLRRRSLTQFAGERLRRLLVPLVFAMFVVIPPQIYFERLYQGAHLSYGEFYPSVFQLVFYPAGSLSQIRSFAICVMITRVPDSIFSAVATSSGSLARNISCR
jgi:peptidoglycan/LPS O-acetylase OafA/YrhL